MNFNKVILDSIYLPITGLCKLKGNDSLVIVGGNYSLDSLYFLIIDTNLTILNSLFIQWQYLGVKDFILLPNKVLILCDILSDKFYSKSSIISLSYNGVFTDSIHTLHHGYSLFAHLMNKNIYFGILPYNSSRIKYFLLDTLYNLIKSDTITKFDPFTNTAHICNYNNKFIVYASHATDCFNTTCYYSGLGVYNLSLDSLFVFNYFNFGNPFSDFDAINSSFIINNSHLYCGSLINFTTENQNVVIACFDTLLNLKWQKSLINGQKTFLSSNIFNAPDGGCIFSINTFNYLTNQSTGYIVWLDSTGKIVNVEPSYLNTFNNIYIYPNPGSEVIHLFLPDKFSTGTFELYNSIGTLCIKKTLNKNNVELNTSFLNKDIYFYRIIYDNLIIFSGKWMKR
ncbi:MAG: T9SS type A sorting domain-containing protein [Bacteroidales bacterium]|nr:T9SS type A sorting domain-containing protein [Bacteroidales bacterium]